MVAKPALLWSLSFRQNWIYITLQNSYPVTSTFYQIITSKLDLFYEDFIS